MLSTSLRLEPLIFAQGVMRSDLHQLDHVKIPQDGVQKDDEEQELLKIKQVFLFILDIR